MERFIAEDGVALAYYTFGAESAAPPVVLHHGFGGNTHANWVKNGVVDALVAAGRRVIAVDARGHGQSDKPYDPAVYGESVMARDLMGLMTQQGVAQYDLVGYSMGAIVSLLVAAQDPRVRRLVVGGVGEGVVVCGGVDTRVLPNLVLAAALEAAAPPGMQPGVSGAAAFVDAMGGDRKALAAQARAAHASPIALDRISAPTLLLAGDRDMLAMRPQVLADAIPGSTLTMLSGDHLRVLVDPRFTPSVVQHVSG